MVFSIFTELDNHYHDLTPEHFLQSRKEPLTQRAQSPLLPLLSLGSHRTALVSDLPALAIWYRWCHVTWGLSDPMLCYRSEPLVFSLSTFVYNSYKSHQNLEGYHHAGIRLSPNPGFSAWAEMGAIKFCHPALVSFVCLVNWNTFRRPLPSTGLLKCIKVGSFSVPCGIVFLRSKVSFLGGMDLIKKGARARPCYTVSSG